MKYFVVSICTVIPPHTLNIQDNAHPSAVLSISQPVILANINVAELEIARV